MANQERAPAPSRISVKALASQQSEFADKLESVATALNELKANMEQRGTTDYQRDSDNIFNDDLMEADDHETYHDFFPGAVSRILLNDETDQIRGPPLNEATKGRVHALLLKETSKEMIDKTKEKLPPPANTDFLIVPKMNSELWQQLPHASKTQDVKLQLAHQIHTKTITALAQIASIVSEKSSELPEDFCEDILQNCVDGINLQAIGYREASARRMRAIRPYINQQYGALCNSKPEPGPLLFGDNLGERLKASRAVAQIGRQQAPRRFMPYNKNRYQQPLNFRGQSRMNYQNRGAMTRGRPSYQQRVIHRPNRSTNPSIQPQ